MPALVIDASSAVAIAKLDLIPNVPGLSDKLVSRWNLLKIKI
jgi:hypothetical protein